MCDNKDWDQTVRKHKTFIMNFTVMNTRNLTVCWLKNVQINIAY